MLNFCLYCGVSSCALQALKFVRDLDTSLLGQNENGLVQFDAIKKCTDELVNAILHVRQLLKRRRFEGIYVEPVHASYQHCESICQHIIFAAGCRLSWVMWSSNLVPLHVIRALWCSIVLAYIAQSIEHTAVRRNM